LEIACALLPMDFHHFEIPSSVLRRAKEIVATKEEPWKSWSKILRNQPGVLSVNRAAIFNLVRIAPENILLTPVAHLEFVNQTMTAEFNAATELMPLPIAHPEADTQTAEEHPLPKWAEAGEQKLADESEAETQTLPKWANAATSQPQVANLGGGVFSIEGLMNENQPQTDDRSPVKEETTSDVQMETTDPAEGESVDAVPPGESADAADPQTDSVELADILAAAEWGVANDTQPEAEPAAPESDPQESILGVEFPAYFEPGRYEGLPNNVYHTANGISSTQVKDARVSLMYFNARHVAKTIPREGSKVLDMGNLVHALALQPENLDEEFSVEPVIPDGAFTTAATLRAFIDEHNASLPALLSADDIKALLEEYNATLPAQVPMGGDKDAIGLAYLELPAEFKRILGDDKNFTATAMKACIKEYNATLPAPVKTSGSRDALLEQLAIINPDLVSNPKQQIAYLALKYWARLYCPAVVLGVYTPDEVEQRTEKEINPAPAQRVNLADIKGDTVTHTHSAQESAANIDGLADDFRDRIEAAQDVDNAKAVRADIESAKNTLGSALYTELKNKAVKRYHLVDAYNRVEAAINSLPQPGEPGAAEQFAEAERVLAAAKRHMGDELHDQFSITLADMKPEYVA